jgi:Ca-activated chloride channel family protein
LLERSSAALVISNGGQSASQHKLREVMAVVGQPEATIDTTLIFDPQQPDQDPGVLKRIAKGTGGGAFLPQSWKEILPICEPIGHDIQNQYTIADRPANLTEDRRYRAVEVKANAPGRGRLSVRARTGFFASSGAAKASGKGDRQ